MKNNTVRSFDDYVTAGAGHNVMKALELLTRVYVSREKEAQVQALP